MITPRVGSMPWLAHLEQAESLQALRTDHANRWPAFADSGLDRIAILGAADEGARLASICQANGITIAAVLDDNPVRHDTTVGDCSVRPVVTVEDLDPATPIVIASHRTLKAVQRLREMGFANVAPFALLQQLGSKPNKALEFVCRL
jgi:FlaA1/EpsC-like NDP-sugar epimerase